MWGRENFYHWTTGAVMHRAQVLVQTLWSWLRAPRSQAVTDLPWIFLHISPAPCALYLSKLHYTSPSCIHCINWCGGLLCNGICHQPSSAGYRKTLNIQQKNWPWNNNLPVFLTMLQFLDASGKKTESLRKKFFCSLPYTDATLDDGENYTHLSWKLGWVFNSLQGLGFLVFEVLDQIVSSSNNQPPEMIDFAMIWSGLISSFHESFSG